MGFLFLMENIAIAKTHVGARAIRGKLLFSDGLSEKSDQSLSD
jgi:hypothetical protein